MPASAKTRAHASPMPDDAPVMAATRPFKVGMGGLSFGYRLSATTAIGERLTAARRPWYSRPLMAPRPTYRFQGVISTTVIGVVSLVSGLIGLDLRYSHGWFAGVKWVEGPVWVQVVVGVGMVTAAVVLARRVTR